ncbi:uncharacterized protein LOC110749210 isoform X3 [Prunus avium]|uniref:Uncharacterized protein LOC110749210 isoform X3 n=1 Tax=Prunus avium TaxID=42229 RepID=A0A6P5RV52_PRUAV|nr:uncharacterized protein LOC110749210 isoform X3 [Prunus avium]
MALITTGGNPSSSATEDIEQLNLNYYQELYRAALKGNWKEAKSFLDRDPDAVKARISNLKMTALHVAACEGHSEFVENIVALMPAGELAELDDLGYTALHYAAIGGSLRSAKALLAANSNLTQVVDSEGRTPLLLAASLGSESKEVVWYLLLVTTDEKPGQPFTGPRAAYLINVLIASGLHEISLYLLEKHPHLATAIDHQDNNCTPLFILARNQSNFLSGSRLGFWETCIYQFLPVEVNYGPPRSVRAYVGGHESVQDQLRMPTSAQNKVLHGLRRLLCGAIKPIASARFRQLQDAKLRHHCAVELVQQICKQISKKNISERLDYLLKLEILNTATVNGTTEILRTLLNFFPDLIWVRFRNNRFLVLTYAIEHRHENLFRMVCDKTARNKLMAFAVLEPRETILHLAAKLPPLSQLSSISGAALQMQRELQWFKVVENLVHPYYKEYPNKSLETARELFTKEHKQLAESGEKWLKDTSNSCMLVAALVATVVFAAAFTAPGGRLLSSLHFQGNFQNKINK